MGEKLVIGPLNRGLRNDVTPFNIDNDSFPFLINSYQWRSRVKRKRGTSLLGRLNRFFNSNISSYGSITSFNLVAGAGNLLSGFGLTTAAPNATIVEGSISILVAGNTYTDPNFDGILVGAPGGSGTINYATGAITIAGGGASAVSGSFIYYPDLPVLGLEDLILEVNFFPGTLAFDDVYSYNISTAFPYPIYDVSFYKNPATSGSSLGTYTPKANWTPTTWNGNDYQQFWTVNYQGALWATNGVPNPFITTNIGMQFKTIITVTVNAAGPPAQATLNITAHGLVVGDFVFINEVVGTTGINWQTGYVIQVVDANNVKVEFPNATIATNGTGGIAQYLTNRSDPTKDGIRWYDGDPTNGSSTAPVFVQGKGWVNFAPPLSQNNFSIADLPPAIYYLVGAKAIVPFKDRLLFFGPVVQTSSGLPKYLQDTVVFSQNGTPYYTASYTNTPNAAVDNPTSPTNIYTGILLPANQTASPSAYFEDSTGFGGNITAGVDEPIISVAPNEDVLIVGFRRHQTRFVYTGNDLLPFNFFAINSEYGTESTFSTVVMDKGVLSKSSRGFVITSQTGSQRFDLQIPDQVFQVDLRNNGSERVCAQRDFINEWIYFTYPSNDEENQYIFPNQTLFYNYRDESFALFNESYTTYGQFRRQTGLIWSNVGNVYPTWSSWNDPWDAGVSTLLQPDLIAGNQQGFVIFRDEGTDESNSLYIQSISSNIITSPDHCLNVGDFIYVTGVLGTLSSQLNGRIFRIGTTNTNTFTLDPPISSGTYLGGGLIKRFYVPLIQSKEFPTSWGAGRKTRIGPQQYLLSTTGSAQITLLIFLSMDGDTPYNAGSIVPQPFPLNSSLIYSTVLYTCPESTNLGLTPANTNLQMYVDPVSGTTGQQQIWHRVNTSLIGDTVQVGFTISDDQMRALSIGTAIAITGASQTNPCVLQCTGEFATNTLVTITDVEGMIELNNNTYVVISSNTTTVTIDVNATGFTAYTEGGFATPLFIDNQTAEVELHGFILDVNQSSLLA